MQSLVLLIGYVASCVAFALGYNVIPPLFLVATALTVYALRAWDRR
jgi:hypothetical protein